MTKYEPDPSVHSDPAIAAKCKVCHPPAPLSPIAQALNEADAAWAKARQAKVLAENIPGPPPPRSRNRLQDEVARQSYTGPHHQLWEMLRRMRGPR